MPKRAREEEPSRIHHPKELPDDYDIDITRVRVINNLEDPITTNDGPVIYWMSRDQRSADNWALLYAKAQALELKRPLIVVFNLVNSFLGATLRQFEFMINGLKEVETNLESKNIHFILSTGSAEKNIPALAQKLNCPLLVCDFSPLRIGTQWRRDVGEALSKDTIPFHEVDAHNIVPCWYASEKLEYAARTIRPRIHRQLPRYFTDFPELVNHKISPKGGLPKRVSLDGNTLRFHQESEIDWNSVLESLDIDRTVAPLEWIRPGETKAKENLDKFCSNLKGYETQRNDPTKEKLSNMSPYFHFGQIAPQRACLEIDRLAKEKPNLRKSADVFLEEAVIRRELSDNYCFYNQKYDQLWKLYPHSKGKSWALETLKEHEDDERPYIYSLEELEYGKTHDDLWNAAQLEMVVNGKMHGFLRMYWAKKILEWTDSPETAHKNAVYLNDKYEIDGRDPNGYVGVNWAIAGIHDQGWRSRQVFGKIRYMNYEGCKRKFAVRSYVDKIDRLVKKSKTFLKK